MLDISSENQQFINDVVASGQFASRREAIDEAVRLLRAEMQKNGQGAADTLTADQWCERFESWAAGHRALSREADDSRESIYAGQGE